jgi:hypothetical protein
MFGAAGILLTITACALAMPAFAQAPAPPPTVFDGTYVGVSRTFEGAMLNNATRGCRPSLERAPAPLTIANGTVRTSWRKETAEGYVNGQGVIVIHHPWGIRIDARIDSDGTVVGRVTSRCSYVLRWQKKSE